METKSLMVPADGFTKEEFFLLAQLFKWSPDGKQDCIYPLWWVWSSSEIQYAALGVAYSKRDYKIKPKAGEKEFDVSIHVYDLAFFQNSKKIDSGNESDVLPTKIYWTKNVNSTCFHSTESSFKSDGFVPYG